MWMEIKINYFNNYMKMNSRRKKSRRSKRRTSRKLSSRKKKRVSRHSRSTKQIKRSCKRYYVSRLKELNPSILRESLERVVPCEWVEVLPSQYKDYQYDSVRSNYLDFLFQDGEKSDNDLYKLLTKVRGRLNAEAIANKGNLHRLLNQYGQRDLIAYTDVYDHSSRPNFRKYDKSFPTTKWIWRPSSGWSGRGVHVVSSSQELEYLWSSFQRQKYNKADQILVSKYIDNPLLLAGYKFHIRMYLIVKVDTNTSELSAAFVRHGKIIRSKEPYVKRDYRNPNIHDTHAKYNIPLRFPEDFPREYNPDDIYSSMLNAVSIATSIGSDPRIKKLGIDPIDVYPEESGKKTIGFEMFGCDFMVDDTGKVYLIEINKKPGFDSPEEMMLHLSRYLFTTVSELVYSKKKGYTYASPVTIRHIN